MLKTLNKGLATMVTQLFTSVLSLLVIVSLSGGQKASEEDNILTFWSDSYTARTTCPYKTYPIDDTSSHHAQLVAFAKRRHWPDIWLPLTKEASDGRWTWWDGQKLSFDYWAPGEPSSRESAKCAIIDIMDWNGRWRAVACDETHNGYCARKGTYVYGPGRGMSSSARLAVIIICCLIGLLLLGALGFFLYRRYTRVKRAGAASGIYQTTSEPISSTGSSRSYKLLNKSSDRGLINNEEL